MKTIGSTDDGGWIVTMTEAEHASLARLVRAIEGKPLDAWIGEIRVNGMGDVDLSNALTAVRVFATALDRANDLSEIVAMLKQKLTAL